MKLYCKHFLLILLFVVLQCRFESIDQPRSAQPGEIIDIKITVFDNIVPETNPHKGVFCLLIPQDWSFVSGEYHGDLGSGAMEWAPNWADSVNVSYPVSGFEGNMKWIGLTSDSGFTYENPITVTAHVKLKVGQTEGQFNLAYLVTKATSGLIGSDPSWAPLSYPNPIGVPDSAGPVISPFQVDRALEWDNLLNRNSGWTGADGIYSIPLSGREIPSDSKTDRTLLLFSDTFIGTVDSNNQRKDTRLVNNTYAVLNGNQPIPEQIDFFWRTDQNRQSQAVFVPETPNSNPGDWYWLMDGIAIDEKIYMFGLRLQKGSGGVFNFELIGVSLISFTLDAADSIRDCQQVDTPLYFRNEAENYEIVLGQAVMSLTDISGNLNPDGYIYVYGPRNKASKKELVAARVLPEYIEDFSHYQYWDGANWSAGISNCAPITSGISQEFSVSPMDDGKFLLVYQFGSQVGFRPGESPVGPFSYSREIWRCPEVDDDPYIFVYNAKAHPHLSTPGQTLISYNVNTFSFWDHFSNADIYRPRFITLQFNDTLTNVQKKTETPESFFLAQNYPNPFNATTTIEFLLDKKVLVGLRVYNLLGQEVKALVDEHLERGTHSITWDGKNDSGAEVCSGVYIYRIQIQQNIEYKKMLLLR